MKNSEKLKFTILTIVVLFVFYQIGLETTFMLLSMMGFFSYLIFNWCIYDMFPSMRYVYNYKPEGMYIKEVEEYIKNADIEYIAITFWWCRFMYYLDYKLNKTKNEEIK